MAVEVHNFPYCCTGAVLVKFGESWVAEGGNFCVDQAAMKAEIQEQIRRNKSQGVAFLSATTNNQQATANEVLTELGFKSTDWMSKPVHAGTQVKLWWLELHPDLEPGTCCGDCDECDLDHCVE